MTMNPIDPLELRQVVNRWENIKRRTRQRDVKTALSLNFWRAVALIETPSGLIVSIEPTHSAYQAHLTESDLQIIEWALSLELNKPCFVGTLPFGTIPLPSQTEETPTAKDPPITDETPRVITRPLVLAAWETAKMHLKQTVPLAAAYMEHCTVLNIEEADNEPAIIIQVDNQQHFGTLKAYGLSDDIEATLIQELGLKCKAKFIPPQPLQE